MRGEMAYRCRQQGKLDGLSGKPKPIHGATRSNAHVFLAVYCKRHGRRIDSSPHLEVPKRIERRCVEGDEVSFGVAGENEAARGRQHSRPCGRRVLELLLDLPRGGINCLQKSQIRPGFFGGEMRAAVVSVPRFIWLRSCAEDVALVARRDVEQARLRIVGRAMKLVVPKAPGQTVCPFKVGDAFLFATGRPSASFVSLHVCLP